MSKKIELSLVRESDGVILATGKLDLASHVNANEPNLVLVLERVSKADPSEKTIGNNL